MEKVPGNCGRGGTTELTRHSRPLFTCKASPWIHRASWTLHAVSCLCRLPFAAQPVLFKMPFAIVHPLDKLLCIHQNQ